MRKREFFFLVQFVNPKTSTVFFTTETRGNALKEQISIEEPVQKKSAFIRGEGS